MLPAQRTTLPRQRPDDPPDDTPIFGSDSVSTHGWRLRAACISADPSAFDPVDVDEAEAHVAFRTGYGRIFCRGCPVAAQCLTEALERHDLGLRGGFMLTARRPGWDPAPCGTVAAWLQHHRRHEDVDAWCAAAGEAYQATQRGRRRVAA